MRKALRIISITTGIISAVSAIILGFIYLEDLVGHVNKLKSKFASRENEDSFIAE